MEKIYYFLIANIIISLFHIFTLFFLIKKSGGKITVEKVASSAKDAAKAVAKGFGITSVKDIINAAHCIFGKAKEETKELLTDNPENQDKG